MVRVKLMATVFKEKSECTLFQHGFDNCRPDVVTSGNPFDTMKRFCLYSQCSHQNL